MTIASMLKSEANQSVTATTYFDGQEVDVKLSEIVLLNALKANKSESLAFDDIKASPLSELHDGAVAAYKGAFGEYVPVILPASIIQLFRTEHTEAVVRFLLQSISSEINLCHDCSEYLDVDLQVDLYASEDGTELTTLDLTLTYAYLEKKWYMNAAYNDGTGGEFDITLLFNSEGKVDLDNTKFNSVINKELIEKHLVGYSTLINLVTIANEITLETNKPNEDQQ
ncbi:hypothetical protein [Vibrio alginolyticus]|uniref:hypothetical protein n=1 Tax=Vibrio alginolyticus TaxID=663 RepID=UPI0006CA7D0D|nr:hypothetical protein [Vibrio alginolyticus]KPM97596.1 hypothetical protein AOG25_14095 [Vibrio alginolyticus]CAH7201923.1 conserved hypothetical protein [Vibrio chagasii]CAH7369288.1 conserved hypothetical protein [Vibrio chagasii]